MSQFIFELLSVLTASYLNLVLIFDLLLKCSVFGFLYLLLNWETLINNNPKYI